MPCKETCGKYSLFDYEKLEKKSVRTLQYFTSHLAQTSDFKENETQRFFSRLHWSVQSLNCVRLFATPWTAARRASLSITNSWSLLKLICAYVLIYAEYILQNAGLDEAQAGIKTARTNINNFRYKDNSTPWQKAKRN